MKRPSTNGDGGGHSDAARDEELLRDFPRVHEHLADRVWEDGSERQVSTLLVFSEDGVWKACIHDREARASLWSSGESIWDAIGSLEAQLDSGCGSWRRDKPAGAGRARK